MRKLLLFVPMMILLLAGCSGGRGAEVEKLALQIRGEYLEMTSCAGRAAITADYGQRVYRYELALWNQGEEMTLTLSAPDTVAGITAHVGGEHNLLVYDGISVETGPLDPEGLSPVSAVPALLEAARSGYISACGLEEESGLLRVDCGDPEGSPGMGTEISLWFDAAAHGLVRGEISVDGFRAVLCEFSEFIMA